MSTKLELTAEVIDIETEGACVILHTDGELLCLSPTDCINLSRALVKAAATVLKVGDEKTPSTPSKPLTLRGTPERGR